MPETDNPQTQQPVERNPIQRKHMLPEKYVANYNEEGEITTDPSKYRQDKISVVNTAKADLAIGRVFNRDEKGKMIPEKKGDKPGGTTAAVDLMQSGANNTFNDFAKETKEKEPEEDKISVAHSLHRQAAAVTKEKRTGSMNQWKKKLDADGQEVVGANGKAVMTPDFEKNQETLDQVKLKFTDGDKELWEQYCAFQLKEIKDVHCWISDLAWNNIKPIYKGWGMGSNFVGKRSEADSLINTIKSDVKLKTPRQRINKLESELGIPKDYWALKNDVEVEKIYRFYILEPENLKIRMPEGTEAGAYLAEWVAGGRALGGGTEFVVDNLSPEDFDKALQLGGIQAWEIDFSTAECQATQMKSLPG
jgi:hypothetical protein